MLNPLSSPSYFPPEFISPKEKEKDWYGLAYAKAIYYSSNRYGSRFFYGNSDYDSLTELAQGRQSVDGLRKLFGYVDPNSPLNTGAEVLGSLDIKVLNMAPKYINRAVAKMMKASYDIGLEAIDILSVDERAAYVSALETLYRYRDIIKDFRIPVKDLFPEIDIDNLPEWTDELLYELKTNPKIKKEIEGEEVLTLVYSINNFNQKMREVCWDLVVYGKGHFHCYLDKGGVPRVDRIHPKYWGGSYVDNDDFEQQEYAFFWEFLSNNDFIKETSDQLTLDEQLEIIQKYSSTSPDNSAYVDFNRTQNYDGLGYIPVMKFYFRSEDSRRFVKKKNFAGDSILVEKAYNYEPGWEFDENGERLRFKPEVAERFKEGGDSELIKNTYTTIYGGCWVIDSDCVFNYGPKKYPRQNLVNATIPIKTFGTNFREGRTVSFLSQMIEPLFMINVAWNKIKEIMAKGYMGILEIDFNQIEEIAMTQGGKNWEPLDVMKFFFKKQILIKRGQVNKHDQKVGNAMDVNTGGLQLTDYMNMFTMSLNMLETMTGTTLSESANTPDRLAVGVMKASEEVGDLDLEYLYNAKEYLYHRTSHQMLLLAQQSKIDDKSRKLFVPALGKHGGGYYNLPDSIAYTEYGLYLTKQPGRTEWEYFYQQVTLAVEATLRGLPGGITLADSAYIMEINNLKKARQVLALRQEIFERKTAQNAQLTHERQLQLNDQSAQMAAAGKMDEKQFEYKLKGQLEVLKGQINERLQGMNNESNKQLSLFSDQMKKLVADSQNNTKMITSAMDANAKLAAVEKRADKSPAD